MNHNITPENIELIKAICINNGITFYDIQVEAIDHIASMVEARWSQCPDEDFETAFNGVKHNIDWRFFKYRNNYEAQGNLFWQILANDKKLFWFILTYLAFIILVAFMSWGKGVYNELFFVSSLMLKCALFVFYLVSGIWIAYKYKKANFMLSNMFMRKYRSSIIFCFVFAITIALNIYGFSQYEYNKSVYGVIMGSYYWLISVPIIYSKFIKVILRAQQKYPKLYRN